MGRARWGQVGVAVAVLAAVVGATVALVSRDGDRATPLAAGPAAAAPTTTLPDDALERVGIDPDPGDLAVTDPPSSTTSGPVATTTSTAAGVTTTTGRIAVDPVPSTSTTSSTSPPDVPGPMEDGAIAVLAQDGQVLVVDAATGRILRTLVPTSGDIRGVQVSPDRTKVLYRMADGAAGPCGSIQMEVPARGGRSVRIGQPGATTATDALLRPGHPDQMAYAKTECNKLVDAAVGPVDGNGPEHLLDDTHHEAPTSWTPDGRHLLLFTDDGDTPGIVDVAADGSLSGLRKGPATPGCHTGDVEALPGDRTAVAVVQCGDSDRTFEVVELDLATLQRTRSRYGPVHAQYLSVLAVQPGTERILLRDDTALAHLEPGGALTPVPGSEGWYGADW